jgi:hypothetical protein
MIASLTSRIQAFVLANALIVMAVLLALLAVQTVRIEGFRIRIPLIGAVGPVGLKADNDALRAKVAKLEADKALAARLKAQTEKANNLATEKANNDEQAILSDNRKRTDAFIAAGGVRNACPRTTRPASDLGPADDAGGSALPVMDDVPVVTVLPEDVRICTENTAKAKAWREWGLQIEANHTPAQ